MKPRKRIVQQISVLLDECATCPKNAGRSQTQHTKRCVGCGSYNEMQRLGRKLLGGESFSTYGRKAVEPDAS